MTDDRGLSEVDDILSGKTSRRAVLAGLASTAACIGPGNTGTRTGTGTDTATDTPPPSETPSPTDTATETPTTDPADLQNQAIEKMYRGLIDPVKLLNRATYGTVHTVDMEKHEEWAPEDALQTQSENYPEYFENASLDTSFIDIRNVEGFHGGDQSKYHWLEDSARVKQNLASMDTMRPRGTYGDFAIYTHKEDDAGFIGVSDDLMIQELLAESDEPMRSNLEKRIDVATGDLPGVGNKGQAFRPLLDHPQINHPDTYSIRIGINFLDVENGQYTAPDWSGDGSAPREEGRTYVYFTQIDPETEKMNFYRAPFTLGNNVGEVDQVYSMKAEEALDGEYQSIRLFDEIP